MNLFKERKFSMKKIICILSVILLLFAGVGSYAYIKVINSPEYALKTILSDVKENGVEGLTPHLTGNAKELVEKAQALSENAFVSSILSFFDTDKYTEVLMQELSKVEWSLGDILKSSDKASVSLDFNYEDTLTGTVTLTLVQEEKEWKINDISFSDMSYSKTSSSDASSQ